MSQGFVQAGGQRPSYWLRILLAFVLGIIPGQRLQGASETQRGVINDPDGYTNVRAAQSTSARVITTIKANEPFAFEWSDGAQWCKVKTSSGKSGWVHHSRIRLHFTEEDLPSAGSDPAGISEVDQVAQARGLDYADVTCQAARGDQKALKAFFTLGPELDGAAADSHGGVPTVVYHLLGDGKFARFLAAQTLPFRVMARNSILHDSEVAARMPTGEDYLRRHFPETFAVLFPQEIIDWLSPNGRYAIRKVFSGGELSKSRVVRAELIDQQSKEVLCDLTRDDLGSGTEREGNVLWSPNSECFAFLTMDLTVAQGNLFSTPRPPPQTKQTVLFQRSGNRFSRVDLRFDEPPGADRKQRLEGAVLGHRYTEPVRWEKPDTLLLQHHEYYERLEPSKLGNVEFQAIKPFGLLYEIQVIIKTDGKTQVSWKEQTER